ncbi:hypothetical protein [Vibrio sp. F74]
MSDTVTSADRKISLATECVSLHNIKRAFALPEVIKIQQTQKLCYME